MLITELTKPFRMKQQFFAGCAMELTSFLCSNFYSNSFIYIIRILKIENNWKWCMRINSKHWMNAHYFEIRSTAWHNIILYPIIVSSCIFYIQIGFVANRSYYISCKTNNNNDDASYHTIYMQGCIFYENCILGVFWARNKLKTQIFISIREKFNNSRTKYLKIFLFLIMT